MSILVPALQELQRQLEAQKRENDRLCAVVAELTREVKRLGGAVPDTCRLEAGR